MFTDAHLRRMKEIMRSVCTDFECDLVEFNGEEASSTRWGSSAAS
ncbi:hypothetical protein [Streptomyces sp. NPDC050287]